MDNQIEMDFDEEEILCENKQTDQQEEEFDNMVYELQELLISEQFEEIQNHFIRQRCKVFEISNENKPEYIVIFKDYQKILEQFIEKNLAEKIPKFSLKRFGQLLESRQDAIDEQILETLLSFSDYELFKEIMVEQKIRVEEEERTLKKKTNKANKQSKQTSSGNIFSINQQVIFPNQQKFQPNKIELKSQKRNAEDEEIQHGDLRPDLFFNVKALQTPKNTKKHY